MNDQQRAVMQMALEALEKADERDGYYSYDIEITALREALAQPQDHIRDVTKKVQGSWVGLTHDEIMEMTCHESLIRYFEAKLKEKNTPPVLPQGEWVDLTDDELMEVMCELAASNVVNDTVFADAVIAKFKQKNAPPVVSQGEWVDLTDDEILVCVKSQSVIETVRRALSKFKSKNTPPVVPQGEPVAWMGIAAKKFLASCSDKGSVITELSKTKNEAEDVLLYTTPPSVEAAIEATLEKAAKVCEEIMEYGEYPDCEAEQCAAAIRGMK